MKEEIILFEDHLRSALDSKQELEFQEKLKDAAFKSRFEEYRMLQDAISKANNTQEEEKLRQNLNNLGDKYFVEKISSKKIVNMRNKFFALRIAASIALIFVISFSFLFLNKDKYRDTNLADKYFTKHGSYVTRGQDDAEKSRKIARDYHEANKLFQAGKYGLAQGLYNSMLFNDNPYKEYAEWNLLMCKLKNKKEGDHIKPLNKLLKKPEHIMYHKAVELEKDLNSFYRKLPF